MIRADLNLIALVFAFYLLECLYFLKPNEIAYTGVLTERLRKWEYSPSGYTLLGRHLCLVNPAVVGVGLAVFRDGDLISGPTYSQRRLRAALRLSRPSISVLRTLCSVLAAFVFVVLPIVVYQHLLSPLWVPLLAEVLLLHLGICTIFTLELRRWQKDSTARLSKSLAVFFNPVAAIRCIDVLSRAIFDELGNSRRRRHATAGQPLSPSR
jgi:hypothetical protein